MVEQSCSPHGGEAKERKRGMDWGPKNPLLGHVPSDPEFPTRLCLLQFPTTSQKCQAKNKAFNAWAFGGQFRSKIQQHLILGKILKSRQDTRNGCVGGKGSKLSSARAYHLPSSKEDFIIHLLLSFTRLSSTATPGESSKNPQQMATFLKYHRVMKMSLIAMVPLDFAHTQLLVGIAFGFKKLSEGQIQIPFYNWERQWNQ